MQITLVFSPAPRELQDATLHVADGCTAQAALEQAGWLEAFPDITAPGFTLGVWGRRVERDHVLRAGDRLEVYRPLRVDPKVARRERFVGQGARGTGLFAKRKAGSKAGY